MPGLFRYSSSSLFLYFLVFQKCIGNGLKEKSKKKKKEDWENGLRKLIEKKKKNIEWEVSSGNCPDKAIAKTRRTRWRTRTLGQGYKTRSQRLDGHGCGHLDTDTTAEAYENLDRILFLSPTCLPNMSVRLSVRSYVRASCLVARNRDTKSKFLTLFIGQRS